MNTQASVAVTSRSFSKHVQLRTELSDKFAHVKFNLQGESLQGESLLKFLADADRAIIALESIGNKELSKLPKLKHISKMGVGLDSLDLEALRSHNVTLSYTKGVNSRAVTELVIANIISLLRYIPQVVMDVTNGQWRQKKGLQLSGKVVGIVGYGAIGQDLLTVLSGFNCTCMVYETDIAIQEQFKQVNFVDLKELLNCSDIVTLHIPLNKNSYHILNAKNLPLMKRGAILVNMARGGLIDEAALKTLLLNDHLRGVALDVFESEPDFDRELLSFPNVIITPHIGGSTEEAILSMGRAAIAGLEQIG